MIQPLRTLHRRSFHLMAAVLPLVFVAGIVSRGPQIPVSPAMRSSNATLWPSGLVTTRIDTTAGAPQVNLEILQPLHEPDPLLYFAKAAVSSSASIPQDAVLLGPARDGARYPLSPARGALVLYSLGHQKVIDQLTVEVAP